MARAHAAPGNLNSLNSSTGPVEPPRPTALRPPGADFILVVISLCRVELFLIRPVNGPTYKTLPGC